MFIDKAVYCLLFKKKALKRAREMGTEKQSDRYDFFLCDSFLQQGLEVQ